MGPRSSFFTVTPQKGQDFAPKRERKEGGHKGKGKGHAKDQKRLTEPAPHHLGWSWHDLRPPSFLFACLSCSCPRSPPFSSVRGRSTLIDILHYIPITLHHHFREKVLVVPGFESSSPAPLLCSCSRSPPFRTVPELSIFILPSSGTFLSHC